MAWTIVVPFKAAAERKSRLASAYGAAQRVAISDQLYHHVIGRISESGLADQIILVSPALAEAEAPVRLWVQQKATLNAELTRIRDTFPSRMMVVNADLPLLETGDLVALADAAQQQGCALAPDRHGTGTNAAALLPGIAFAFAFGPDSLRLHRESAPGAALVQRTGLAYDVDTLADIEAILALKQPLPADVARLLRFPEDKGAQAALAAGD